MTWQLKPPWENHNFSDRFLPNVPRTTFEICNFKDKGVMVGKGEGGRMSPMA